MTIAFYDTLISIGVDDVKAKAAAISVREAIDAKYDIDPYQKLTYNDLQLRCSDLEMYLNEFKFDFIKWILTAALVSIIVCVGPSHKIRQASPQYIYKQLLRLL